ncbi:MAG: acireductone dioxygenase [Pseudomonadaceae bacterium]|nr:acireductone dioxygenase [Pseudomonadaceae bacterium]
MSSLTVTHQSTPEYPDKLLTHSEDIASTLARVGAQFAQHPVAQPVVAGTPGAEVLAACQVQVEHLLSHCGFAHADVLSLCDERGEGSELATTLAQPRLCESASALYVLAGRCLLALHIGEYVYSLVCEKGDLLQLPAGCVHWLDVGEHPRVALLCLFAGAQQAVFLPANSACAGAMPGLDEG